MNQKQQPSTIGELSNLLMWICIAAVVLSVVCAVMMPSAPAPQQTLHEASSALFWSNVRSWSVLAIGGAVALVLIIGSIAICVVSMSWALDHWKRPPIVRTKNGSNGVALVKHRGYDPEGHRIDRLVALDLDTNNGVATSLNGSVQVQTFGHEDPHMRGMIQGQAIQQRHNTARQQAEAKQSFVSGGTQGKQRSMTVAEAKANAGVYDAQREAIELSNMRKRQMIEQKAPPAEEEPDIVNVPIPPIGRAVSASSEKEWIMGANSSRGLAKFSPEQNGHLAIFGTNGSGKTKSSGMMSVLHAKQYNWNVIVLDGKGGGDWKKLGNNESIHYHEMTGDNIDHFISVLSEERKDRMRTIGEYESLHEAHRERRFLHIPKTLVVFEELGASILSAPDPAETSRQLGALMRIIRAAGLHLSLIEQSPDKNMLSNGIKANALYFVYRLPGHQHRVVNATGNVQYMDPGRFELYGEEFQAWNVYEESPISDPVAWPDLFGRVAKSTDIKSALKGKKLVAYNYVLANPDQSIREQADGAGCSDRYIKDARKLLGIS